MIDLLITSVHSTPHPFLYDYHVRDPILFCTKHLTQEIEHQIEQKRRKKFTLPQTTFIPHHHMQDFPLTSIENM